ADRERGPEEDRREPGEEEEPARAPYPGLPIHRPVGREQEPDRRWRSLIPRSCELSLDRHAHEDLRRRGSTRTPAENAWEGRVRELSTGEVRSSGRTGIGFRQERRGADLIPVAGGQTRGLFA